MGSFPVSGIFLLLLVPILVGCPTVNAKGDLGAANFESGPGEDEGGDPSVGDGDENDGGDENDDGDPTSAELAVIDFVTPNELHVTLSNNVISGSSFALVDGEGEAVGNNDYSIVRMNQSLLLTFAAASVASFRGTSVKLKILAPGGTAPWESAAISIPTPAEVTAVRALRIGYANSLFMAELQDPATGDFFVVDDQGHRIGGLSFAAEEVKTTALGGLALTPELVHQYTLCRDGEGTARCAPLRALSNTVVSVASMEVDAAKTNLVFQLNQSASACLLLVSDSGQVIYLNASDPVLSCGPGGVSLMLTGYLTTPVTIALSQLSETLSASGLYSLCTGDTRGIDYYDCSPPQSIGL